MQIFGGGSMQEALKMKQQESCTQFEVTSNLLRNLYKFNLTPVTKLVLLELTTHLNESKNGSVVFPSVGYIAEVLGIGLTAAKKAINDLIKQGIIIKTKRNNVKGNYNKYLFTSKISGLKKEDVNILSQQDIKMRNSTSERSQNELFKQSENDLFLYEQTKETKKEQTLKSGENVYTGDDFILYEYAKKKAKYSVDALIKKIKENGGDKKIISEYKKRKNVTQIALRSIEETQNLIQKYKDFEQSAVDPKTCAAWVNFGKLRSN